jgi:hypothetical protein
LCQTYHRLKNHFGCTRWFYYMIRLKWKVGSVYLEIVLILTQDRCTVCTKRTYVIWVMWNLISVHLETMLLSL